MNNKYCSGRGGSNKGCTIASTTTSARIVVLSSFAAVLLIHYYYLCSSSSSSALAAESTMKRRSAKDTISTEPRRRMLYLQSIFVSSDDTDMVANQASLFESSVLHQRQSSTTLEGSCSGNELAAGQLQLKGSILW